MTDGARGPDDRDLIRAAKEGSAQAFEELVRRHQLGAYRVALRILGSTRDAEDVAQEAFIQVWRSLVRFRGESAFSTWVYRIVTNRALNLIRARRETDELEAEVGAEAGPEQKLEERERMEAVIAALGAIGPEQRALIVLRELEGLSYREIGEIVGLPPSLVKGRLHRARLALVAEMGED